MSKSELAHTSRNEAVRYAKENTNAEQNPLLLVPAKAANAVNFFLGVNAHLNKPGFQLSIAYRVRYWLESEGLSVVGLTKAFKMICRPNRQAEQEYIGKLMADLAAAVDDVLKDERQKAEERRWKDEQAAAEKTKATSAEVKAILATARRDDPCKTTPFATGAAATA